MFDGVDPGVQPLYVAPDQLATWASRVRPYMDKMAAGSGGRYHGEDLLQAVAAGRMQLWIALRGSDLLCAMLTEIHRYPRATALRMIGLVGSRPREWRGLLRKVEATSRDILGCDLIEAFHLPRFAVILPGYKTTHWFGEKRL